MADYRTFRTVLAETHGEAGLAVRHELFAHAVGPRGWRGKPAQILRTLLVAFRDLVRLASTPAAAQPIPPGHPVAAVSLPGASGWGTLRQTISELSAAGLPVTAVLHPRLPLRRESLPGHDGPARRLSLRAPAAIAGAVRAGLGHRGKPAPRLSGLAVRLALVRLELWRAAWRSATGGGTGAPILLHNDFDIFSTSALGTGRETLCLQHGLPTDEFFPCRADRQAVWSEICASAYRAQGVEADRLFVARFRERPAPRHDGTAPPVGIALLSQSHAAHILPDIADRLAALALALHDRGMPFRILLHPEEVRRGHPYPADLAPLLSHPPHPLLEADGRSWLVAGLLSTALLDLADLGHFVVGLDWKIEGQDAARAIGQPPRRALRRRAEIELSGPGPEALQALPRLNAAGAGRQSPRRDSRMTPAPRAAMNTLL
ncbi:MAG: hypothetical protein Q7J52_11265, partial [Falsiroseomonas sp.]